MLNLVDTIEKAGAHIKALDDPWLDTTTPHGELILTVMGGLAEFERKLIRQRAATRGSSGPRPGAPCSAVSPYLMSASGGRSPSDMPQANRWQRWPVSMSVAPPPSGVCCTDSDHARASSVVSGGRLRPTEWLSALERLPVATLIRGCWRSSGKAARPLWLSQAGGHEGVWGSFVEGGRTHSAPRIDPAAQSRLTSDGRCRRGS
jgi:resolvase-like protein